MIWLEQKRPNMITNLERGCHQDFVILLREHDIISNFISFALQQAGSGGFRVAVTVQSATSMSMFGIFKRRQPSPQVDITNTMVTSFGHLRALSTNPDRLQRLFGMNARIAAMMGALRDTYPGLPMDDNGPGGTLTQNLAARDNLAGGELADALFELVRGCPNDANAKMNVMIFIMSPASIPMEDRPCAGVLGHWSD